MHVTTCGDNRQLFQLLDYKLEKKLGYIIRGKILLEFETVTF